MNAVGFYARAQLEYAYDFETVVTETHRIDTSHTGDTVYDTEVALKATMWVAPGAPTSETFTLRVVDNEGNVLVSDEQYVLSDYDEPLVKTYRIRAGHATSIKLQVESVNAFLQEGLNQELVENIVDEDYNLKSVIQPSLDQFQESADAALSEFARIYPKAYFQLVVGHVFTDDVKASLATEFEALDNSIDHCAFKLTSDLPLPFL